PLSAGSTIKDYQEHFEGQVIPFLKNFQPDLVIVSAGYDANQADPLAGICLHPQDYGILTKYLLTLNKPLLFGLEGGYDLETLAASVVATLEALL
ncbi:MAG: histone deacetylase, partial [Microcystis aeruginosa]